MVGRGLEIQKLIRNILKATENEDQRLVLFTSGDIVRRLMTYEPIEDAVLSDQQTLINVISAYAKLLGRL